jgi:hypothetical protein
LTGTFGGAVINSAASRSYPFSYTVSSANTWTSISVTIVGDTSGTWVGATNGIGVSVRFGLGAGSTFSATAGAWAAGNYVQPTGTVSVVGTASATFYITGVQFEVGSVATPFERRLYGQELMLCQRYLPAFSGNNLWFPWGIASSATAGYFTVIYPVQTRVAPTGLVYSSLSHFNATDIVGLNSVTTAITFNTSSNMSGIHIWQVTSGATTGRTSTLYSVNNSALIYFTGCEL